MKKTIKIFGDDFLEKAIEKFVRVILSLDALLPMLYVYLIKDNIDWVFPSSLENYIVKIVDIDTLQYLISSKIFILAIVYLVILIILSKVVLFISTCASTPEKIKRGSVEQIEIATDSFLPSYLGYFFVALSIPNIKAFSILFILIYLFAYKSRLSQFNPTLLLLGYKYYYFSTKGIKSLIITKNEFRDPKEAEIENLIRINDYTFLEIHKGGK